MNQCDTLTKPDTSGSRIDGFSVYKVSCRKLIDSLSYFTRGNIKHSSSEQKGPLLPTSEGRGSGRQLHVTVIAHDQRRRKPTASQPRLPFIAQLAMAHAVFAVRASVCASVSVCVRARLFA